MFTWFKGLSGIKKAITIAILIIAIVFVFDLFTGTISDIKGRMFDKATVERLAKVEELEKSNIELRVKNQELEKKILESEAKDLILKEKEKTVDAKTKQELIRLDQALAQQAQEEAITELPTDAYTRCVRTKDKMIALNIKAAQEINCENKK